MKNIEILQIIISVITSLVSLILLMRDFKWQNKEKQYYQTILQPYIVEFAKNNNIKTINAIRKNIDRKNDNIPKYI